MKSKILQNIFLDGIPILIQHQRTIKRLSVKVHPYKGVVVNAPFYVSETMLNDFLTSVAPWIKKHYQPISLYDYTHGEHHPFLGVHYPLNFVSSHTQSHVALLHEQLNVYSLRQDSDSIRVLIERFYRTQADSIFPERVSACMQMTPWVKRIPKLKYRFMTSRYGSCSSKGNISLNIHLIKARIELIDYVILHELCHLQEHHHGPKFYQLMNEVAPNWKQCKEELRYIRF